MKHYHCTICVQSKPVADFSKWTENKNRARRCNSCLDDENVKKRIATSIARSKRKDANATSNEKETKEADKQKCKVRDAIAEHEERKQRKELGEYFEL